MSLWIGARRFTYSESLYFGNPGKCLTYVLAFNDAGFAEHGSPGMSLGDWRTIQPYVNSTVFDERERDEQAVRAIRDFRADTLINTYAVGGAFTPRAEGLPLWIGVDLDQVRLLNP